MEFLIIKKKKCKAFTLIELLVVVAIIGILSAVGVVAYNSFIGDSRVNTTRANHAIVVKYMASELKKCELGSAKIFNDTVKCPIATLQFTWDNPGFSSVDVAACQGGAQLSKIMNAYDLNKNSVSCDGAVRNDYNVGFIRPLTASLFSDYRPSSPKAIAVVTCIKLPCNISSNILAKEIFID